MKKYKLKVNQEKLKRLKDQLKPGRSYFALAGIVLFFFLPEIAAFLYGDAIKAFFQAKEASSVGFYKTLYNQLESLGEVSYLNIALGVAFSVWFFKEKFKKD